MRKHILTLGLVLVGSAGIFGQNDIIEVYSEDDSCHHYFVKGDDLYSQRWDTLAQPAFWKKVIVTDPDSCIVNIAATREILGVESFVQWQTKTDLQKKNFKDSVRHVHDLAVNERIYITSGKRHFYQVDKVMPSISRAIELFEENSTDPWYAQAILLIESPGKLEYSNTGAYGPFQLMKSVARAQGLTVNSKIDERKDFDRSAFGASSLIRKICIPEARRILRKNDIAFQEDELWFKLFVLHIYHAGAANIDGLIASVDPENGGQDLITTMWQSEWGGFRNASQNYSQVALASLLTLNDRIYASCEGMYDCEDEMNP